MKINLAKFKNLTGSVSFFWQTLVIIFFVGLTVILILNAVFWFKLELSLTITPVEGDIPADNTLSAKDLTKVLDQIKTRSADLASTTTNLPTVVDPAR